MLKAKGINGNGMGMPLTIAATTWPTMRTGDGAMKNLPLPGGAIRGRIEEVVTNWPTPNMVDAKGGNRIGEGQAQLCHVTSQWSTPRASDGEKGGPNQSFGAGGMPLAAQTSNWMTPTVMDTGVGHQYQNSRGDKSKPVPTLTGQAFSLPGPATLMSGAPSSSALLNCYRRYRATTDLGLRSEMRALLLMAIRRRGRGWTRKAHSAFVRPSFRKSLNPRFVAWLMGWAPPASTGCGFSATAWFPYRARMRSALLELASPRAALPVQHDLFA